MEKNFFHQTEIIKLKNNIRDFTGGPVAKTLPSQYKGPEVHYLVRELDPTYHN